MTVNNRVFIRGKCGRKFGRRNGFVRYFLRQATIGLDDAAWSCALEACEDALCNLFTVRRQVPAPPAYGDPCRHFTSTPSKPEPQEIQPSRPQSNTSGRLSSRLGSSFEAWLNQSASRTFCSGTAKLSSRQPLDEVTDQNKAADEDDGALGCVCWVAPPI